MLAIRKNLRNQTTTDDKTIMFCLICHAEYSANAADYWDHPDDYEFKCCGEVMQLGTRVSTFVPKEEAE